MATNIWTQLKSASMESGNPILIQAPMEDVTNSVFRRVIGYCGKPDLYFTEFTNVDGVFSEGYKRVIKRLKYTEDERPIIAQIWGHKPENYFNGAKYVMEKGFDGVDINMGCPQKDVVRKGLCSALIDNEEHAAKVIQATIDGVNAYYAEQGIKRTENGGVPPVSVKTRLGVKKIDTERWARFLLGFDLSALTFHGRTVKEMSKVPAHWDEIAKAVQVRNEIFPDFYTSPDSKGPVIIGNGDVRDRVHAQELAKEFGVDGVMIGRGIFDNIFCFNEDPTLWETYTPKQKLELLNYHLNLYMQDIAKMKSFTPSFHRLKKYVKIYIRDFDGAAEIRAKIMDASSPEEMQKIIEAECD